MIKVFVAQHHSEAHWVRGLLESAAIPAEVRGEDLFTVVTDCWKCGSLRPDDLEEADF